LCAVETVEAESSEIINHFSGDEFEEQDVRRLQAWFEPIESKLGRFEKATVHPLLLPEFKRSFSWGDEVFQNEWPSL